MDEDKLEYFDSLLDSEKKSILGVSNNFYFYFDDLEISGNSASFVGMNSSIVENQIKLTRIVIYKNKIIKFEVIAWS